MRIISKYKDYYDNAMSYGIDTTQVFVRNEAFVEIPLTPAHKPLEDRHWGGPYFVVKDTEAKETHIDVNYIVIGFCGSFHLHPSF